MKHLAKKIDKIDSLLTAYLQDLKSNYEDEMTDKDHAVYTELYGDVDTLIQKMLSLAQVIEK